MAYLQYFNLSNKLNNDYISRIQRQSTLYSVNGWIPKNKSQIYGQIVQTIKTWRDRVQLLRSEGQINNTQAHFMSNCRPTFVSSNPVTRCCRYRWLCPFCYARKVADYWQDIESVLFSVTRPDIGGRQLFLDDMDQPTEGIFDLYDLVYKEKIYDIGVLPDIPPRIYQSAGVKSEDWLYFMSRKAADGRKNLYTRNPAAVALFRQSSFDIKIDSYWLINRELWLVKKDSESIGNSPTEKTKVFTSLTRKDLLKLCTEFFKYPRAFLFANAERFVPMWKFYTQQVTPFEFEAALEKPKRTNSTSRYGLFRNRKKN